MIKAHIEQDEIEFEIQGDIPTITCEVLSLVSAVHRMLEKVGKNPADEFRLGFCSMVRDEKVVCSLFGITGSELDWQTMQIDLLRRRIEEEDARGAARRGEVRSERQS